MNVEGVVVVVVVGLSTATAASGDLQATFSVLEEHQDSGLHLYTVCTGCRRPVIATIDGGNISGDRAGSDSAEQEHHVAPRADGKCAMFETVAASVFVRHAIPAELFLYGQGRSGRQERKRKREEQRERGNQRLSAARFRRAGSPSSRSLADRTISITPKATAIVPLRPVCTRIYDDPPRFSSIFSTLNPV